MASSPREELILHIEWEYIDACNGFTFDMGGSAMKVVYVSKDDWVEPSERKKGSKGCLRMVNFSRNEIDEAIQLINTKARLVKNPSTGFVDIYSSGYGGTQYAERFKKELLTSHTSLSEFDCFVQSFMHLVKTAPRKEVVYPASKESYKVITAEMNLMLTNLRTMRDSGETAIYEGIEERLDKPMVFPDPDCTDPDKPMTENEDLFPCLVMMLGSGFAGFLVQKDGSFNFADRSIRGATVFSGLGSVLAGGKNYTELMEMCEKGNLGNVTMTTKSVQDQIKEAVGENTDPEADSSMYTRFNDDIYDQPIFTFGHTVGKTSDDFKKEDLVSALLNACVNDVVSLAHAAASKSGVKHVFLAGGFVNNRLVRESFTVEWLRRDAVMVALGPGEQHHHMQPHFMVHAQSLGALGALLNHRLQWHEKQKPRLLAKAAKSAQNAGKPAATGGH